MCLLRIPLPVPTVVYIWLHCLFSFYLIFFLFKPKMMWADSLANQVGVSENFDKVTLSPALRSPNETQKTNNNLIFCLQHNEIVVHYRVGLLHVCRVQFMLRLEAPHLSRLLRLEA